jgi:SOS-response transcriptional repressor LexA
MDDEITPRQGQFLAFIYYYTKINRIPPAEADMQRFFRVTPPAVHEMVKTLERKGFIAREPGKPRTIRVLLPRGSCQTWNNGCSYFVYYKTSQDSFYRVLKTQWLYQTK